MHFHTKPIESMTHIWTSCKEGQSILKKGMPSIILNESTSSSQSFKLIED